MGVRLDLVRMFSSHNFEFVVVFVEHPLPTVLLKIMTSVFPIVKLLMQAEGTNQLHLLIESLAWKEVDKRLSQYPKEARKFAPCEFLSDPVRKSFALPLHHAVALGAPLEIVQKLLDVYPKSISTKERAYHRLPLTIACQNAASGAVILLLLNRYPHAVKARDDFRRIPLHYAVANHVSSKTITQLLETEPSTISAEDHRKWTALHVACAVNAPGGVVEVLLAGNPEAVLKTTPNDGSPWTLYLQGYLRDQESLVLLEKARNSLQRKEKCLTNPKAMRDRIQI